MKKILCSLLLIHHLSVHAGRPLNTLENENAVKDLVTMLTSNPATTKVTLEEQLSKVHNPNVNIEFSLQLTHNRTPTLFTSPLTAALCLGNLEVISALLDYSATDPNYPDEYNKESPLATFIRHYFYAPKATRENCLALLLNHPKTDPCFKDSKGFTPRFIALETNNKKIAQKINDTIKQKVANGTATPLQAFISCLDVRLLATAQQTPIHQENFSATYTNPVFIGQTNPLEAGLTNQEDVDILHGEHQSDSSPYYQLSPLTSRSGTPMPEDEEEWYDFEPSSPEDSDGLESQFSPTEETIYFEGYQIEHHPSYV